MSGKESGHAGMDNGHGGRAAGQAAFSQWMDTLRRLKALYEQLLEAELARREAVRRGGAADIAAATEHQRRLLDRFDELDRTRRERMAAWRAERGLKPDPRATLSGIIAELDDEAEREAVRGMRRQLQEAAARLKAAAEANRDLAQASLDAVTALMAPGSGGRDDYLYGNGPDGPAGSRPSGYDIRT